MNGTTGVRLRRAGGLLALNIGAALLAASPASSVRNDRASTVTSGTARASHLPRLAYGTPAPSGASWVMSAVGACNRQLADVVAIDAEVTLSYSGDTPADVLTDASIYGARWRMAAVDQTGTVVATTEWCSSPPVGASSPVAAVAGGPLTLCRCAGDS